MVRKVLSFLYKESGTLHKAAYLLGAFALASQLLAFLRDRLLAHLFGAGGELDIYYAAFRIPDFLFVTVASIVSISVLVPFIVEKEREGRESLKRFIDDIFGFFSILIIFVSVAAFILMPALSGLLFKGLTPEALEEVIYLSRIMLLSPIFLGLSNLFGSLTQAYNRFLIYAFAPLFYNASIIIGIMVLVPTMGILGVVLGVVGGAVLHFAIQVPFVAKLGLFPTPRFSFNLRSVRRVAMLSLPRTLSLSTSHIATLFLISLASLMTAGSISIYSFALNIQSVPLSIIGVSFSLAAFPTLSRHFADKNIEAFIAQIAATARHIIFWSMPAMVLFIVLRAQIVRVLLGTGQFGWDDTRLTAAALALFSVSVLAQSLLLLFTRGFYSAGFTRKPFLINLVSMMVLLLTSYGLVKVFYAWDSFGFFLGALLKVGDLPNIAVLVLPLAFSIGTIFNAVLHWRIFEKDFLGFTSLVRQTFFESFSASVIMGAGAYAGLHLALFLVNTDTLWGIFTQGLLAGLLGLVTWLLVLILLGSRELRESWQDIRSKFWRTKVIATDPEIV